MNASVHPTAVVSPNVSLGEGSIVGEYTITAEDVKGLVTTTTVVAL